MQLRTELNHKIDNHGDGRTLEKLERSIHTLLFKLVKEPFELSEPMIIGVLFLEDGGNGFIPYSGDVREKLSGTENDREASSFAAMAVIESGWVSSTGASDGHYDFILTNQSPDLLRFQGVLLVGPGGVLSTLRFANDPDKVIVNRGTYTLLGEALVDFWTR